MLQNVYWMVAIMQRIFLIYFIIFLFFTVACSKTEEILPPTESEKQSFYDLQSNQTLKPNNEIDNFLLCSDYPHIEMVSDANCLYFSDKKEKAIFSYCLESKTLKLLLNEYGKFIISNDKLFYITSSGIYSLNLGSVSKFSELPLKTNNIVSIHDQGIIWYDWISNENSDSLQIYRTTFNKQTERIYAGNIGKIICANNKIIVFGDSLQIIDENGRSIIKDFQGEFITAAVTIENKLYYVVNNGHFQSIYALYLSNLDQNKCHWLGDFNNIIGLNEFKDSLYYMYENIDGYYNIKQENKENTYSMGVQSNSITQFIITDKGIIAYMPGNNSEAGLYLYDWETQQLEQIIKGGA